MGLTDEQKARFWGEGYLAYGRVLSDEEVAALKQRSEEIATGQSADVPERYIQVEPAIQRGEAAADSRLNSIRKMTHLAYYDDLFRAAATKPQVLDVIEGLLGPNLKLYTDQLMMKPPGVGSRQAWHQDSAAWMFFIPHNHVSCWIALEDATLENGCMRVIPGSHQYGIIDHKRLPYFLAEEEAREVPIPLPAGSCMFHHSLTLHSSHANTSPYRRRGLALHYIRAETRYLGEASDHPCGFMWLRGQEFPGRV